MEKVPNNFLLKKSSFNLEFLRKYDILSIVQEENLSWKKNLKLGNVTN